VTSIEEPKPEPEPEPEPELEPAKREQEPIPAVDELLDAFIDFKRCLAKTSQRWSAVLLIEVAITTVIALEPVLFTIIQSQSDGTAVNASEASVFFAATIPFIYVLIVGLVGISRMNESISAVPAQLVESRAFTPSVSLDLFIPNPPAAID
jgi:hypothetical protein